MNSIAFPRAATGVATLGVAALTATAALSLPVATHSTPLALSAPVTLTADSTWLQGNPFADFFEAIGVGDLVRMLDNPETPFYPLVIAAEGMLEVGFVLPLTYLFGIPLTLLTEGPAGVITLLETITPLPTAIMDAFAGIGNWYATHNPFTGALLNSDPLGLSSLLEQLGLGGLLGGDGFNLFDPSTWGLGDLLGGAGAGEFDLFDMSTWGLGDLFADLGLGDLFAF
ncbi:MULTISPECIES: hypothetical protein [Mycolicibacter]|uniref:PE-PGRS family protein n=2 Tax=Mycolicibacter TaxID=1073531 RepID=A0ABU5XMH6_9MYCO|nr:MULTISPECIES: hypothetical protein [unclassified Mycolicibacter]MEB3023481.1 hypothetical protein [Mycolicibacter sp. MYC098]MEB3035098.1 hypothetical protein [Mycolicibacter sp. MYC340]